MMNVRLQIVAVVLIGAAIRTEAQVPPPPPLQTIQVQFVNSTYRVASGQTSGSFRTGQDADIIVARRLKADNIQALSVTIEHAAAIETLQLVHRDPFDRLLIVQARHESLSLLTADDRVLAYGSPAVDVRA
jgi:PIN domain nuclease of toxin-antitoxin system